MGADPSIASAVVDYVTATAPVILLQLDTRQCVIKANAYARRVLGGNLEGKSLRELVVNFTPVPEPLVSDATVRKDQILSVNTAIGLPETFHFEFFELSAGLLALGSLDFDEQTRLRTEVLGLNRELNDLSRQLHQANAELRELNEMKSQFLGMAAHDLRKPVGVITTYTEFVLDETGDTLAAEHRKFLQTSLKAAESMKDLIDDFLDVSVIESGKLRLNLEPIPVAAILDGALEIGRLVAARKKIALLVEAPADGQRVWVDAPKLQQVLVNLIGNAVEHSQSGQRVWVSSRWHERELVFAVRDEGPGIPVEDQVRLFQPFERAGTRKTAGERSVGLGLAIASQVAGAHRGRLWVESIPGAGATFFLALPIVEAMEEHCA